MSEENFSLLKSDGGELSAVFFSHPRDQSDSTHFGGTESQWPEKSSKLRETGETIMKSERLGNEENFNLDDNSLVQRCEEFTDTPSSMEGDNRSRTNLVGTEQQQESVETLAISNYEEDRTPLIASETGVSDSDFGGPTAASTPLSCQNVAILSCEQSNSELLQRYKSSTEGSGHSSQVEGDEDSVWEKGNVHHDSFNDDRRSSISVKSVLSEGTSGQASSILMMPGSVRVPIVGYETMESRSKFTVYKIHVMVEDDDTGWFIFRRYSDFLHLNDQLRVLFPNLRLSLPPKRWFRSNFECDFLEERQLGLQAFLDNVTGHRDICNSAPVRSFFCFDEPPGPHDSLEESRAQCEYLEEMNYLLRRELSDKEAETELLQEELELYKNQVLLLTNRLSELNAHTSSDKMIGTRSKSEIDALIGIKDILKTNTTNTKQENAENDNTVEPQEVEPSDLQ